MTARTFGKRLRKLREQKKMTLKDLSEVINCSIVYVSDIERDRRNPPSIDKIIKIGEALGSGTEELLELAATAGNSITLSVKDRSPTVANAALILARKWGKMDDERASQIVELLNS